MDKNSFEKTSKKPSNKEVEKVIAKNIGSLYSRRKIPAFDYGEYDPVKRDSDREHFYDPDGQRLTYGK